MERWELESDERLDGEMKNRRMKKNKRIILIGMLNKKLLFFQMTVTVHIYRQMYTVAVQLKIIAMPALLCGPF